MNKPASASRNLIIGWAEETANGGNDRRPQSLRIAARDGIPLGWVNELFDAATKTTTLGDFLERVAEPTPSILSDTTPAPKPPEKPKPEEPVAAEAAPKPKPAPLCPWTDAPHGLTELEALTYVPGLVGDIVEWIVRGARRPNRVMALGVATVVVGTLVGRMIEGPTESATHLFVIILAPTGYGKDWPLHCGNRLMEAAGAVDLLGPGEFASSPGFMNRLKRNPLMVCFVDELGDELDKINNQANNPFVSALIGTLKKCYNAFGTVMTAETVAKESERIMWPAPSLVGAATPERFFEGLRPRDLESGFANRLLILPFEGRRRPAEQEPLAKADDPPDKLIAALKRLPRQKSIGDQVLDALPGQGRPTRNQIGWGDGASEVYLAFSRKMDSFEETDRQRYELGMRACENAVRLATILAVGRGSKTVDKEDIEWGVRLAERSFEAAVGGVAKYMREYFEFPKFCEQVLAKLAGGRRSRRDLERDFRSNKRYGFELKRALEQLEAEGRIEREYRSGSRGPAAEVYKLVHEENLAG